MSFTFLTSIGHRFSTSECDILKRHRNHLFAAPGFRLSFNAEARDRFTQSGGLLDAFLPLRGLNGRSNVKTQGIAAMPADISSRESIFQNLCQFIGFEA